MVWEGGYEGEKMKEGEPTDKLWSFNYIEVGKEIKACAAKLGVTFTPYQLRHSGPSWDRLKEYRTLQEVQKRGGWRTTKSVMRYEQAARSLSEYAKVDPAVKLFMEEAARDLKLYVLEGKPVPPAPRLRRGGPGALC